MNADQMAKRIYEALGEALASQSDYPGCGWRDEGYRILWSRCLHILHTHYDDERGRLDTQPEVRHAAHEPE